MRRALGTGLAAVLIAAVPAMAGAATAKPKLTQLTARSGQTEIFDVAVAPTGSGWAVGHNAYSGLRPTVWHLSAGKWKSVTLPSSWHGWELTQVSASSGSNVWAFGDRHIAHYNGHKWTLSASTDRVSGAAAVSAKDVWMVDESTTARHFTGKTWKSVKLPAGAESVRAVSAKNVWAAGWLGAKGAVMHYDGKTWKVVKTVEVSGASTMLRDVTVSGKNVWATGYTTSSCGGEDSECDQPVVLRLSGKTWTTRIDRTHNAQVEKATADGSGGAWIVEFPADGTITHATTGGLTRVAVPTLSGHSRVAVNSAAIGPNGKTVWLVGESTSKKPSSTHIDGVWLRIG